MMIDKIVKRDGSLVDFDASKIANAILKADRKFGMIGRARAEELAGEVTRIAEESGEVPSVEGIQDIVEKVLIDNNCRDVAKEYIIYRAERGKARDMRGNLKKAFDDILLKNASDVDNKRENANIDANTSMGTMLKFGSEAAKMYYEECMIPAKFVKAHRNGDIHIHDEDFYGLTETCIVDNTKLVIKEKGIIKVIEARDLNRYIRGNAVDLWCEDRNLEILSGNKFVRVLGVVKHKSEGKKVLKIKATSGELCVTSEHRVTVKKEGKKFDIKAECIQPGMELLTYDVRKKNRGIEEINLIDEIGPDKQIGIENSIEIIENIYGTDKEELKKILGYERIKEIEDNNQVISLEEYYSIRHLSTFDEHNIKLRAMRSAACKVKAILSLTKEVGKAIGYIHSMGNCGEVVKGKEDTILRFKACTKEEMDSAKGLIAEVFEVCTIRCEPTTCRYKMVITQRMLGRLLKGPLGIKEANKCNTYPRWMYAANKEFLSGFLGELIDSDNASVSSDEVSYVSKYLEELKQLQDILRFNGVCTSIEETGDEKSSYKLVFKGDLNKKLGWIDSKKLDSVNFSESEDQPNEDNKVESVEEIEYEGYVYDLETKNHHFNANGYKVHNCCHIDLDKLFKGGFNTGHGYIREPNSIGSYSALACIAIQSNQNEQHGGQSIPKFDYDLAKGITKTMAKELKEQILTAIEYTCNKGDVGDKEGYIEGKLKEYVSNNEHIINSDGKTLIKQLMIDIGLEDNMVDYIWGKALRNTEKLCSQAMEALVHNLNTMHSRAGAQVPFSSINFGTDISEEGRMISRCLLNAQENGMGNGESAIFPITIFKVKKGVNFNEGDPNYDLFELACKVSAKRMFPNFVNIDAPGNIEYYDGTPESEIATMGCRTRVISDVNGKATPISRGNLSFTSINLPRLAIESRGNITEFFDRLNDMMYLVKEQLLHRYKVQCNRHVYNYPFLMGQGVWEGSEELNTDDTLEGVLKHGTLGIGFIGLAETLKVLTGKHHGESEDAQKLGLKIVGFMREKCDTFTKEHSLNFGLLGTPAEGLSGRFVKMDKERYGIIEGVTDREYYTNSSHVPVYYKISAKRKIDIEAPYHVLENGGHIGYVELDGDTASNIEAFESVVRYMINAGMGYCSINHPIDRDPLCGYTGVIKDICPRCGRREGEGIPLSKLREIEKMYNIRTEGYFKVETPEEMDTLTNENDVK